MIRVILSALYLCSCLSFDHYGIDLRDDLSKVRNQDKALIHLQVTVEDAYGYNFGRFWESLKPRWAEPNCPYADPAESPAFEYHAGPDGCVTGVMFGCDAMYIGTIDRPPEDLRTHQTALTHEVGHCLMQTIQAYQMGHQVGIEAADPVRIDGPYGDPGHQNQEFWELMEDARRYHRERDW